MRKVVLQVPQLPPATLDPQPELTPENYDFYELVPGKVYLGEIITFEWKRIEK